ncbi:MAG: hypothetical protein K0S93_42 [Nitrososphaeraceae archaeon]|jgi:hypothetical protein|nr:hypothetical protein [Nitrososphaeraceae archaeon]
MFEFAELIQQYKDIIQEINDCLDDKTLGGEYEELTSIGYRDALKDVVKDLKRLSK